PSRLGPPRLETGHMDADLAVLQPAMDTNLRARMRRGRPSGRRRRQVQAARSGGRVVMRGADAGIDTAVLELAPLWTQAQRAYQSACVGAQWLVLGICAAFLAPKLELGWLARVAAMAVAVSALFHGRAAWLETRFALAVRACVWNRWRANALPELACLRRLGRGLAWAAVAGWTLAGVVS
ncbi:hypothetical protein CATMIT_01765, partial [Catenibacterium mitsuokai DSM 15897]